METKNDEGNKNEDEDKDNKRKKKPKKRKTHKSRNHRKKSTSNNSKSPSNSSNSNNSSSPKKSLQKAQTKNNKDLIAENFVLITQIGQGAFGQIFLTYSMRDNIEVAIKKEKKNPQKAPKLKIESKIYQTLLNINDLDLSGTKALQQDEVQGVPKFYGEGELLDEYYLIMEFLGPNLIELLNYCGTKKFTIGTVCLLALQMLNRIENLHRSGYIHRDIKPENFLIGTETKSNIIYLVDFGLSKRYKNSKNNMHIPYREGRLLTGTARYVSINTHLGIEQSRRDDLESIGYVLLFFLRGSLPWQGLKTGMDKYAKIMEKKLQIPSEILCYGLPEEMTIYLNYCKNLRFEDKPEYDYLRGLFIRQLSNLSNYCGITKDLLKFDWCYEDQNYLWKLYDNYMDKINKNIKGDYKYEGNKNKNGALGNNNINSTGTGVNGNNKENIIKKDTGKESNSIVENNKEVELSSLRNSNANIISKLSNKNDINNSSNVNNNMVSINQMSPKKTDKTDKNDKIDKSSDKIISNSSHNNQSHQNKNEENPKIKIDINSDNSSSNSSSSSVSKDKKSSSNEDKILEVDEEDEKTEENDEIINNVSVPNPNSSNQKSSKSSSKNDSSTSTVKYEFNGQEQPNIPINEVSDASNTVLTNSNFLSELYANNNNQNHHSNKMFYEPIDKYIDGLMKKSQLPSNIKANDIKNKAKYIKNGSNSDLTAELQNQKPNNIDNLLYNYSNKNCDPNNLINRASSNASYARFDSRLVDVEIKLAKENLIKIKQESYLTYYEIVSNVGEGSYGEVKKVRHLQLNEIRAMKIVSKDKNSVSSKNEIEVLRKISHPNIVNIFEIFEDQHRYYIICEYCDGGELFDAITKQGFFTEVEACRIIKQVLQAVNYLHNSGIIHRDLKPENIMFISNQSNLKLIDFGTVAQIPRKGKKLKKFIGTSYYLAPEVILENYDEKCDIWSCGIIMYILLCGYPPFNGVSNNEIYNAIQYNKPLFNLDEWSDISKEAINLITLMLDKNPNKRVSAEQALNHKWFKLCNNSQTDLVKLNKNKEQIVVKMTKFIQQNKFKQAVLQFISTEFNLKKEEEELKNMFKEFDKEDKGTISREAFISQIEKIQGGKISKKLINEIFSCLDLDGSGTISYNEFLTSIIDNEKILTEDRLSKAFKLLDKNGNGLLSVDEIKSYFGGEEETWKKVLKEVDKNGDGEVDYEEFKILMIGFNPQEIVGDFTLQKNLWKK